MSILHPYGVASPFPLSEGLSHLALSADAPEFPHPKPPSPHFADDSSSEVSKQASRRLYGGPSLSLRSTGGPDAGPLVERFSCLFENIFCCDSNPEGIVSLGVAENGLMADELVAFFGKAFAQNFLASDLSYGDDLFGSRRLKAALVDFYTEFFRPCSPLSVDHLIVGAGCSAILDQLAHVILDSGDGILLAAPYYSGFDRDLRPRSGAVLVGVPLEGGESVFDAFSCALRGSRERGIRIKALLVTNPENPKGKTQSRETLLEYCAFAEANDLHLISDEIYGLSVYDAPDYADARPFTSMLSLDVEKEAGVPFDRARLHVVHGMSKDFCSNGLRLGVLISQHNPLVLRTLANTSMLMKVSSPADVLWTSLLTAPAPPFSPTYSSYLQWFLAENKARLTEAHAYVRSWFVERGVQVADSNAGHFVWVNLGQRVGWRTAAEEKRGFQTLLDGGVYIAPGSAYHYDSPGWFRVTISVKRGNLDVGLSKIETLLGLKPANDP